MPDQTYFTNLGASGQTPEAGSSAGSATPATPGAVGVSAGPSAQGVSATQAAPAAQQVPTSVPASSAQTASTAQPVQTASRQATPRNTQARYATQPAREAQNTANYRVSPGAQPGMGNAQVAAGPGGSYYQTYPTTAAPRKSKWWIPLLIIFGLLLLMGVMFSSCMAGLTNLSGYSSTFEDNTVAVINIDGTIQYDGTANSPEGFKTLLDTAAENDNIKAIVLRVNSGGGVAAAGEEMSTYLTKFDKPVVVSSAALNASAAYMISAQSDYIYVLNSTDIGSIGTIMQHYDLSELLAKLGINIENIKSADSKDSSYYNRPLTEEERAEYQHQVDVINNNFIRMVSEGRKMTEDEVRALADGSTKVGKESVDAGLADEVGTYDDACKKAAELANLGDNYNVENLTLYSSDFSDLVGLLSTGDDATNMKLLEALREMESNGGVVH